MIKENEEQKTKTFKFNNDKIKLGINTCLKKSIKPEILINEIKKMESDLIIKKNKKLNYKMSLVNKSL